ncbi:uncharacterized protein ARMOST_02126 [Armillaria ostoyae]|uniref:Uncharacterized protein n=1 Tax=Armillaria ostoyae TaxID=47428 RepID=A0A284QQU1_ARMOS|nr:uncharacterized protein ARMOST_02126 [Armillaria ostoyae]
MVLYRTSSAFLVGKLQAEALIHPELVPLGAEVIRIDDYFKDRHFVANLLRYTIVNTLSRAALWQTIAVYMEDIAVLDNSMASAEKVRLMTCVEGLLNTGIYHLEKSIRKTIILTVDSARNLFERNQDEDPTFSQLRFRSDPSKPNLDPSSLEYALVTFALLFGAGDAQEEHQVRNHLARKFMDAKKDSESTPKINGLLLRLLTRWLRLLDFSRKTGFARVSLDLVTRLPHDQRITGLDEKNRLLQKVVDDAPLESIIPTLGSLKDTATFKRVWNALDVAACRFGSGHSGIEDILGIELRCTGSVFRQRHADKRSSPQAGKSSDRSKSAIQNLVQPSPPSPVDSNIYRVSLSGEVLHSERGDAKAAATTRTNTVDVDSESNAIVTSPLHACSDKSAHPREVSSSVEDFTDDEYDDSLPGLFVGAISFGEPPSSKKQKKPTSKPKKRVSTSEPVPQWKYPIYVKRKTLTTFKLILDSKAKGTLEYRDFERAMADLDFLIEPGGKGSKIFRPPGASINKQPFICDPPHNAKLSIDETFRLRIRKDLHQLYGWSEYSFALKQGRDAVDYFAID